MSSHSRPESMSEREDVDQSVRTENEQNSATPDNQPTTTVMIYLAGDNNLTDECIYALTELKKAKASKHVKIYVQFDPSDEFLPTQRYEINQDDANGPIADDLIDQFEQFRFKHESKKHLKIKPPYGEQRERKGETGTGDPRMLFNFVAFCVDEPHKRNPTKTDHYVLIICGHGAGIQRDYLLRDDRPDGYLTIYELRSALELMRTRLRGKDPCKKFKLDLFGMDVCLMSMSEIAYEFRDLVDIAIANESYSPAAGWPYLEIIQQIDQKAKAPSTSFTPKVWEGIAKKIVTAYVGFYSNYWLGGLSVSMSALKVNRAGHLKNLVRALANEMINELYSERERKRTGHYYGPLFSDALILAHWRTQSYNGELYVDLADFCDNLAEYMPDDSAIAQICAELSNFIKYDFTLLSCSFGRDYQYSYGVSIYFPWQTLVPYYGASIHFPEDSNWLRFLDLYLKVTRREPRFFSCPESEKEIDEREKREIFELKQNLINLNFTGVRMVSDKMVSDKMGLEGRGNPIHSMRNPPIVFIPDCCLPLHVQKSNAAVQATLMKDELEPTELLRSSRIKELEARNAGWVLLTEEPPADPAQLEADNADES